MRTEIFYSERYSDDSFEYRHVILTPEITKLLQRTFPGTTSGERLLTEAEWRSLGVTQSRGWVHYACHKPEPHILLFRRALAQQQAGGA
mmetsp:Transcript_54968/g.91359  ORF Transcript_54968/g.91359 Transcript_54968/m.91359 type:complete len:89 (-) Transcript_54968:116-382(-)|eukprot:CAMPEP_0184341210 /NCGR_PEP_ID=MMETSP1089-20130417/9832_1 /TAXON_ID=38269 ORGANISM="Gloeochaete wittrockiana, Strain SAG46.84" /NCGR_SAMPLE_ID=MMETSP1089 /ASSEMBLY_ACC=CAM_ASM_000445 /LENGTH=88 /DNA_ID=CAMNT_0026669381 /DNA_START=56 /DNA_END=322 /DNA_ORIENTATION=-